MFRHQIIIAGGLVVGLLLPDLAQARPMKLDVSTIQSPAGVAQVFQTVDAKRHKRLKPGCRAAFCKPGYNYAKYRKWKRRKEFGRIVSGVVLGAVIVTAANRIPARPSQDLCWYWSNQSRTHGYWDYCY